MQGEQARQSMQIRELFIPAVVSSWRTIDPGEICAVALTLPREHEVEGKPYVVRDVLRPGNAFLARVFGARTRKIRRRMYTRSNSSLTSERVLETIINHTHEEKADTSMWWQSDEVAALQQAGGSVDIRVGFNREGRELVLFENSAECGPTNLRLEPDDQWPAMRFLALSFSTGITPFLAYLRHMKAHRFGRTDEHPGTHLTLVASVRNPRQLMEHEELLELERTCPDHFRYYPVLTREWPTDWPYGKGRIIRAQVGDIGDEHIDLGSLLSIAPEIPHLHVRMCGNSIARDQLLRGLQQNQLACRSFRSEVW